MQKNLENSFIFNFQRNSQNDSSYSQASQRPHRQDHPKATS